MHFPNIHNVHIKQNSYINQQKLVCRKQAVVFCKDASFTLILSTLASSFSCSTSRRMLDKLELEVMLFIIVLGEKKSLGRKKGEKDVSLVFCSLQLPSLMGSKCWTGTEWPGFFPNDLSALSWRNKEWYKHTDLPVYY